MHNSSQIWKTINDIVRHKSKQKHNLSSFFINEHNVILKDPVKISNSFNNYFTDVRPLLAAKITSSNNHTAFQNPTAPQNSCVLFFKTHIRRRGDKANAQLKSIQKLRCLPYSQ